MCDACADVRFDSKQDAEAKNKGGNSFGRKSEIPLLTVLLLYIHHHSWAYYCLFCQQSKVFHQYA